jgi:Mg-chelatase subunit ChlD
MRNVVVGLVGISALTLMACGSAPMASKEPASADVAYGSSGVTAAPAAPTDSEEGASEEAPMSAAPQPAPMAPPGVAATGARPATPKRPAAVAQSAVRAGEWDDNANYRDFLAYIGQQNHLGIEKVDVTGRRVLVVQDKAGAGVPSCAVDVKDAQGKSVRLTTAASGRALLFPRAHGLSGSKLTASTSCVSGNDVVSASFDASEPDGATVLKLKSARAAVDAPVVDVVFVLDTTGSMSEEIQSVKDTLQAVVSNLDKNTKVRVGLVEYKDRGDEFVTKVYPFTTDLAGFSTKISGISASGGGDTPEDVNAGLQVAMDQMAWSSKSVARLAFLIADAPPHLEYPNATPYAASAKKATEKGIKLFTVSASGMDEMGQAVFRQVAQLTGGTNMFVLRGGAGSQSTGAGDAKSSCGGTHENFTSGNLDQLITRKIKIELASLKADPMRIAGLGQDENAKPCDKRIMLVAQ